MWINPKYAPPGPPAPAATPPEDRGRRLGTIARGRDEEFRINLDSYQGRPYVALRVWARSTDGAWWPVRGKGCSVRLRELAGVIEALRRAEDLADDPDRSQS